MSAPTNERSQDNENGPETVSAKTRLEAVHPATRKEQNMHHRNTALTIIDSLPTPEPVPTVLGRDRVAGHTITHYSDPEHGRQIAIDTDEVIHVENIPELVEALTRIHRDYRQAEARSYFASTDAIDPLAHTIQSLARFAEENGFDVPAFMIVATEVVAAKVIRK